jgi:hypothetical protein
VDRSWRELGVNNGCQQFATVHSLHVRRVLTAPCVASEWAPAPNVRAPLMPRPTTCTLCHAACLIAGPLLVTSTDVASVRCRLTEEEAADADIGKVSSTQTYNC